MRADKSRASRLFRAVSIPQPQQGPNPADMKPFGSYSLVAFPLWVCLPSAKIKAQMKTL